jgi:cell division protein FtsI/penicillin-binding protein 2
LRLFFIQVISYGSYKTAAADYQLKQYEIPPTRGQINILDGNNTVPLVLNQTLYTIYADPSYVKDVALAADKLAPILNKNSSDIQSTLSVKKSRYVVLAKKVSDSVSKQILGLKIPGIGSISQSYRIYPQGSLASQVLGFVNDDGVGEYGIEQALNKELTGVPGRVKAVTDINGIPLASSSSNIQTQPVNGSNINLSLDLGMQSQMEQILASQYQKTKSNGLSAIIMDPNTGQIKAMANYPTYDPTSYQDVSDLSLFQNAAVSNAIEPGSSMKVLTTAAALNLGVVKPDTTYNDPAKWIIDNTSITNIEADGGARQQSVSSILSLSLNTGAVWLLMQMGGGQITDRSITNWHDYLTNHYNFGKPTNIEQGYESNGLIPKENFSDPSLDLTYANTAFGQGLLVTDLQMAAAVSSIVNGGVYYQPTLVSSFVGADGKLVNNKPVVVNKNVVSPTVSQEMLPLMENVVNTYYHEGYNFMNFSPDYIVGGKTGTAQVADLQKGGYKNNIFNGTYVGFVGGDKPQYVIAVFNIEPDVPGYAGALGGQPVFADLAHMLINEGHVQPKTK